MNQVSILVATCGRPTALRDMLNSLCDVRVPDTVTAELILVENGAPSGVESLLAALPEHPFTIKYLYEPVAGKSRALNRAFKHATGDIFLFTDDDVRFPKDWLVEMCKPLLSGEGSVVVGGSRLAPRLLRPWMTRQHRSLLASTEYLCDDDPSEFAGVNMACRREVFGLVPHWDCELGGGGLGNSEDSLLAYQFKEAGYAFVSRTTVHLEHHPAESRLVYGAWLRAASSYGRSIAYYTHHWRHETLHFVRLRLLYFLLKLHLRLLVHRRQTADSEGIPPWELSYRIDIAKLQRFLHERRRPRNYAMRGLVKLRGLRAESDQPESPVVAPGR